MLEVKTRESINKVDQVEDFLNMPDIDRSLRSLSRYAAVPIGEVTMSTVKETAAGSRKRNAMTLAARIQDNATFIEDLVRIGAGSPDDIEHLLKNIAMDAEEIVTYL